MVTYPDGTKGILIAGGPADTTALFLNLQTLIWEPKPNLPHDISQGVSVPFLDSFLIVGGESLGETGFLDTIYYFNPGVEEWVLMDVRMEHKRVYHAAFMVPDSYANCT